MTKKNGCSSYKRWKMFTYIFMRKKKLFKFLNICLFTYLPLSSSTIEKAGQIAPMLNRFGEVRTLRRPSSSFFNNLIGLHLLLADKSFNTWNRVQSLPVFISCCFLVVYRIQRRIHWPPFIHSQWATKGFN